MQDEFDFTTPPPADDVATLCAWLRRHPGFHTAREISAALHLSDRQIRKLAEHSDGMIVSGPGCPGYQHLHHCSASDLSEVADRLKSQARAMLARSIKIRRKAHALIH